MFNIETSISNALLQNMKERPENIAAVSDNKTLTNKQLYEIVDTIVLTLSNKLIHQSTIVGLRFEDQIKHLLVSVSLLKMGVTQVSINVKEPPKAQQQIITQTGVQLVVQDLDDDLSSLFVDQVTLSDDFTFNSIRQQERQFKEETINSKQRPALIFMGSGTTDSPKILAVNFLTLAHQINRDLLIRDFKVGEVHYSVSRFDYYTTKRRSIGCLLKGGTLLFPCKTPERQVAFCRQFKVDHLSLTTDQAIAFLTQEKNYPPEPHPKLPRLRSLFIGSSPSSESIRKKIREELSEQLFVVYGTNEFGEATIASPEDQIQQPGTIGYPCPGVTIEIVGPDGNIYHNEKKGKIRLKSDYMMDSYFNNAQASSKAFSLHGYYPGDLGYITPNCQLVFSGREDDMMIFQGVNIYPREIEQILELHPKVSEAAAFPLKIDNYEGVPFAAVHAYDHISEKELLQLCREKLGWKSPKRIFFVNGFPHNAAGKILKRELISIIIAKLKLMQKSPKNPPVLSQ